MLLNKNIKIFETPLQLANQMSDDLMKAVEQKPDKFFIAISGGSTPNVLFKCLANSPFKEKIEWRKIHFFWCDERCVPPSSSESNYGIASRYLFNFIPIPGQNIHRIYGESEPRTEVIRYANEIEHNLPFDNNDLPQFDLVLLGMGEDGHTASLFPTKNFLFLFSNIAGVSQHPATSQKRISLTKDVLCNSKKISFMVTGRGKAKVLSEIIKELPSSKNYPAAEIKPVNGKIDWMIDKEASFYL